MSRGTSSGKAAGAGEVLVGAMTVEEAAGYLRISRTSLFRLFNTGAIKPARIAGRTLVRRVDADALLERAVAN